MFCFVLCVFVCVCVCVVIFCYLFHLHTWYDNDIMHNYLQTRVTLRCTIIGSSVFFQATVYNS